MGKIAVLALADTETHGDMGRIANALMTAVEFKDAGDEVQVVFDGAAVGWIGKLADSSHPLHKSYRAVEENIAGACRFCAAAFGATEEVRKAGVRLLGEHHGHPSVRSLVVEGYQVVTF